MNLYYNNMAIDHNNNCLLLSGWQVFIVPICWKSITKYRCVIFSGIHFFVIGFTMIIKLSTNVPESLTEQLFRDSSMSLKYNIGYYKFVLYN